MLSISDERYHYKNREENRSQYKKIHNKIMNSPFSIVYTCINNSQSKIFPQGLDYFSQFPQEFLEVDHQTHPIRPSWPRWQPLLLDLWPQQPKLLLINSCLMPQSCPRNIRSRSCYTKMIHLLKLHSTVTKLCQMLFLVRYICKTQI